jgi:hypothetical protein
VIRLCDQALPSGCGAHLVLLDMFPRVVQDADDMVVVQAVVRHPAGSPDAHESRASEQSKLVRYG